MKRNLRGFRPTALDGTHQLEERVVLSQVGAAQIGTISKPTGISQDAIDRDLRDVDEAFRVLSNAYAREFAFELHSHGETGQLANGFNDDAVDLLNQELLGVVSRLPQGTRKVGTDVVAITELMRFDLNHKVSVDRASGPAAIDFAARLAHDTILSARDQVHGIFHDYVATGMGVVVPPPDVIPPIEPAPPIGLAPPLDSTLPSGPSNRLDQETIHHALSHINWSFAKLSSDYSRAFNLSLRGVEGTGRLTHGFNDHQVGHLNERLLRVLVDLPFANQIIGPSVIGVTTSLRTNLNSQKRVDRTSDPASIASASRSAREAILATQTQVQIVFQEYLAIGAQHGLFFVR
jgi:hypothetical protein